MCLQFLRFYTLMSHMRYSFLFLQWNGCCLFDLMGVLVHKSLFGLGEMLSLHLVSLAVLHEKTGMCENRLDIPCGQL